MATDDRTVLTVSKRSWHYRIYNWHYEGWPPHRLENLCHYMRVVLIWAPLHFIFGSRIHGWLRSWMLLVPAMLIGATIWGLLNYFDFTIQFLIGIAVFIATMAAVLLVIVLASLAIDRYKHTEDNFLVLVGGSVSAWKHKICPFIDIQD